MNRIRQAIQWAAGEAWEKVDLRGKWEEIKETGQTWGPRFIVVAVIWEIIEDGVFPFLSWYFGMAWLIPIFLIWHFEPVVYPIFFWMFRTYDRSIGVTPWEADRPAYSSHWRTALKVGVYRVVSLGALYVLLTSYALNPWLLTGYVLLMTFFNFAHERIWHDSNFGITVETDEVMFRRVLAKTFTYRIVSMMFLTGVFVASLPTIPWTALLLYQGFSGLCYMGLETAWARSTLGITGIPEAA